LEEEEREKAMKEAKAKAKKEKKQRQKGKKKGKSKEEQLAADQVSEGGGKDAEKHLMQQQPAGEGNDEEELCVWTGSGTCTCSPVAMLSCAPAALMRCWQSHPYALCVAPRYRILRYLNSEE